MNHAMHFATTVAARSSGVSGRYGSPRGAMTLALAQVFSRDGNDALMKDSCASKYGVLVAVSN